MSLSIDYWRRGAFSYFLVFKTLLKILLKILLNIIIKNIIKYYYY